MTGMMRDRSAHGGACHVQGHGTGNVYGTDCEVTAWIHEHVRDRAFESREVAKEIEEQITSGDNE